MATSAWQVLTPNTINHPFMVDAFYAVWVTVFLHDSDMQCLFFRFMGPA